MKKKKRKAAPPLPLTDQSPDAELVKRASKDELEAFDILIKRYERRVIGLCFRHLGQYEEACDLAQEVFLQVFKRLHDFEGRSSFSTWLYRVALNACYNRHRYLKAKGRGMATSLEGMLEASETGQDSNPLMRSEAPQALDTLEADESKKQLRQALDELDTHYKQAVELVDIEGLSYEEASGVLKIPVNTVRSRLSRARTALKQKIMRMRKRLRE